MRKLITGLMVAVLLLPMAVQAGLQDVVRGRILLQIEANGEAWYINPLNHERYYLGRPADAFVIMREQGLGIAHDLLTSYRNSRFPEQLAGKILLDVEANGEAYYIYPLDLQAYYLGRPDNAFQIMRDLGLGITDYNLSQIPIAENSPPVPEQITYSIYNNHAPYNFGIKYPQNWVAENNVHDTIVQFYSPFTNADDVFSENVNIVAEDLYGQSYTATEYASFNEIYLRDFIDNYQRINGQSVLIGGAPAYRLTFSGSLSGQALTWTQWFFTNQTMGLVITYTGDSHEYDKFFNIADYMANSFHWPADEANQHVHLKGALTAPVQTILYADFECPFSFQIQPALDQLLADYPNQVNIEYRHFPLSFHNNAKDAALAAECAAEQGKFWEFAGKLWLANETGALSIDQMKAQAAELNLNVQQFNNCLDSQKYLDEVNFDADRAITDQVAGTPALIMNGTLIQGAIPYEQLEAYLLDAISDLK